MMISYADNFEDVVLDRVFQNQKNGFYVDVGAWHPSRASLTCHFYRNGWHGINIEPQPAFHRLLERDRARDVNLNVAIGNSEGPITMFNIPSKPACATSVKTLADEYKHEGRTTKTFQAQQMALDEIYARHIAKSQPVDILKVDVEGSEKSVLQSLDFAKYRPRVVIVEATKPHTRINVSSAWSNILTGTGYTMALFDGLNCFFSAEPTLIASLSTPVNVFDRPFITQKCWEILRPDARQLITREYLMYEDA